MKFEDLNRGDIVKLYYNGFKGSGVIISLVVRCEEDSVRFIDIAATNKELIDDVWSYSLEGMYETFELIEVIQNVEMFTERLKTEHPEFCV